MFCMSLLLKFHKLYLTSVFYMSRELVQSVTQLYNLFNNKRWVDNEGNEIVYHNYCTLLTNLNNEERELILELTDRYDWITYKEYNSRIISLLNSVEVEKIEAAKKIYFFPIMKPEDEDKTKSGHVILYVIKAVKPLISKYRHVQFEMLEKYEDVVNEDFKLKAGELFFLVDDYIGSGETIKATIHEVQKNRYIEEKSMNVLAIAAQCESVDFLKSIDINFYIDITCKKGISDHYQKEILEDKIKIMQGIEKMIPVKHFNFGYNACEGLITMMRTPDNTFPIFWKEYKKDGEKFDAPFARY